MTFFSNFIVFGSAEKYTDFLMEADQNYPKSVAIISTPNIVAIKDSNVLYALNGDKYEYWEADFLQKLIVWWDKRAPARFTSFYQK